MMKIVVSAKGTDLEAQVDPRFGRSSYFLLVNPESMEYEVLPNGQNVQAAQGAGIQTAALIARQHPGALLTGNCGPKAYHTLLTAGIPVFLGVAGSVREAVQEFCAGKLTPARGPNVTGHW
jgi:predicted Fe-Mo cluster-binding NifX family protein